MNVADNRRYIGFGGVIFIKAENYTESTLDRRLLGNAFLRYHFNQSETKQRKF